MTRSAGAGLTTVKIPEYRSRYRKSEKAHSTLLLAFLIVALFIIFHAI